MWNIRVQKCRTQGLNKSNCQLIKIVVEIHLYSDNTSVVIEDLTAEAKAKDLTSKAKAKVKDLIPRPRPRPRCSRPMPQFVSEWSLSTMLMSMSCNRSFFNSLHVQVSIVTKHYCIRVWKLTLTMAYYSASIKTSCRLTLCTNHSSLKLYYHSITIVLRQ